jgi:proteasome lid subunit RPN8/RPN11
LFRLSKQHADEMIAHAKADAPNECCGILAGVDGEVKQIYRARNSEASPVKYNIDSKDQFRIQKEMEANGWDYLGLYHSHTFSEAYPSPTDVRLATYEDEATGEKQTIWPGVLYFLVSLREPDNPEIRAFHIVEGEITEEELAIEG